MSAQARKVGSPSRTYVAMCNKSDFSGYYFRKFTLPTHMLEGALFSDGTYMEGSFSRLLENSPAGASWYFLNHLNLIACIEGVITWEDFSKVRDQDTINAGIAQEHLPLWG